MKKTIYISKKDKIDFINVKKIINNKLNEKIEFNLIDWDSIKENKKIILSGFDSKGNEYTIILKNKKSIFIYFIPFILIFFGIGAYYFLENNKNTVIIPEEIAPDVKDAKDITKEDLLNKMNQEVEKGYFNIQINQNIIFENGSSYGTIKIINAKENTYSISVDIKLTDTNETIYSSGIIKNGQFIEKGKLDRVLEKGKYKGYADIKIYNNDSKEINNPTVQLTIDVKN